MSETFDGNIVKREWFRFYDQLPPEGPSDRIVQSWDVAMMTGVANDYSVYTTWGSHGPIITWSTSFAIGSYTPTFAARS
jgi:hypothetical protein